MTKLKDTNHDYSKIIPGNFYSTEPNGSYISWEDFKKDWAGFNTTTAPFDDYDDTYNFLFRFDMNEYCMEEDCRLIDCIADDAGHDTTFELVLLFLLQRKGIYSKIRVENITEDDWTEIKQWLEGRKQYLDEIWTI